MNINFIRTQQGLTVFQDGKPITITASDPRWPKVLEHLAAGNEKELFDILDPAKKLNDYVSASGKLKVDGGVLLYNGEPLPGDMYIVQRALQQIAEGVPVQPLLNFIENLMQNPSRRAVQELLQFLEYGKLPITPDGHFLAYKRVREDYKDVYSGKISNHVGAIVEMPRNEVDDDSSRTCSYGLHFCSREYLNHFSGARLMVLKINPRDVVSIPRDYNNTKGRCCRYEVVDEITEEFDPRRDDNAWKGSIVVDYTPSMAGEDAEIKVGDRVDTPDGEGIVHFIADASFDKRFYVIFSEEDEDDGAWFAREELDLIDGTEQDGEDAGLAPTTPYVPLVDEIVGTTDGHIVRVTHDYGPSEEGHGRYRTIIVNRPATAENVRYYNSDQLVKLERPTA